MDDRQIPDEIKRIVDREHQLRAELEQGQIDPEIERRAGPAGHCAGPVLGPPPPRQARRSANQDEDDAAVRPASQVERYLQ